VQPSERSRSACRKNLNNYGQSRQTATSPYGVEPDLVRGNKVRNIVDAFIQAVEEARRNLIRQEGRDVSEAEMLRRAGYAQSQMPGAYYHLNPRVTRKGGHKVPAELVRRLAAVLPISEEDLARAAQVAAGFNVVDTSSSDVAFVVARYFGDEEVSEEEKRATTARLLQILAEESQREQRRLAGPDS